MTNSSYAEQSAGFFQTLTIGLVVIATALTAFVGLQIINEQSGVAHGEAIDHPKDLNAEFFADESSQATKVADATTDVSETDTNNEVEAARGILAQANNQNESGQCDYITDNLRIDFNNDSQQVYKLQAFLQAYDYDYVDLTGEFGEDTLRAVQAFQTRHAEDILEPWGYEADEATGYVYITTRQKINEIYCDGEVELSAAEQNEIANYREKLNRWRAQGAGFDTPQYLAQYRAQNNQATDSQTAGAQTSDTDDELATQSDTDSDQEQTDSPNTDQEENDSNTTATTSDETEDDDSGFFARLFGQDGDDTDEDNQGTSTDNPDDNSTTSDGVTAGTSATNGVDQAATSVYSGVNSVVGFIFSPTFLLILLGVLILLLIATLLEDDDEGAYADITADDFAKDFEDSDTGDTDTESDATTEDGGQDSKTKSANFDDTPAGDNGDSSSDSGDGDKNENSG